MAVSRAFSKGTIPLIRPSATFSPEWGEGTRRNLRRRYCFYALNLTRGHLETGWQRPLSRNAWWAVPTLPEDLCDDIQEDAEVFR